VTSSIRAPAFHFQAWEQGVYCAQLCLCHSQDAAGASTGWDGGIILPQSQTPRDQHSSSSASVLHRIFLFNIIIIIALLPRLTLCVTVISKFGALPVGQADDFTRWHAQLFPRGALEMYTAKNMGWEVTPEQVWYRFSVIHLLIPTPPFRRNPRGCCLSAAAIKATTARAFAPKSTTQSSVWEQSHCQSVR
jgi:hypothetical protein